MRPAKGARPVQRPGSEPVLALVLCLALLSALFACTSRNVPSPLVNPLEERAGHEDRDAGTDRGDVSGTADGHAGTRPDANPQGRVSPVYEQWLFRQSMLAQAETLLSSMPRTLLWRHSAHARNADPLLEAAPTWAVADVAVLGSDGIEKLNKALPTLASLSVSGLWLSRALESDLAWVPESVEKANDANSAGAIRDLPGAGRAVSFSLAPSLGSDKELSRLTQAFAGMGMQGGMAGVSAATGSGPDFMLEARGSSRHQGLYAMWEVPQNLFGLLPDANGPWDVKPLDDTVVARLREKNVIPGPLRQETDLSGPGRAGFAVTGEVLCVDGQTRRHVYRHAGTPLLPVLDWGHPRGGARTLLLASALRTTGVLRQALNGLDVSALAGLDRTGTGTTPNPHEPAQTALGELASMVRRCGGWSLVLNPGSIDGAQCALEVADFVEAPGFSKAVQGAVETGDARGLANILESLKGMETSRLAFAAPSSTRRAGAGGMDKRNTRPAGPGEFAGREADDGTPPGSTKEREGRCAHLSQALSAGLPGLCLLDGEVLLDRGFAKREAAPSSAALLLRDALEARTRLDLARGVLVQVEAISENALVAVVALPGGGHFVTALNFADKGATLRVNLRGAAGLEALTPGAAIPQGVADGAFALTLEAGQAAHYLARR